MRTRAFEPGVVWSREDGTLTERAAGFTRSITAGDRDFDSVTVVEGFGCNGKTAQTEYAVNAAVTGTAGAAYTATEQTLIADLKALVNQLRAALVANGIAV